MAILWLLPALLLFWAIGAYSRLTRLRAAALRAFGALDACMARLIALAGEYHAARAALPEPDAPQADSSAALQAAATQFGASLAATRATPLDAGALAALAAGAHVLETAWQTALRQTPQGADGSAPEALAPCIRQREQLALESAAALAQFNAAVTRYNQGIAQFPANLLARLSGLKPARTL